MNYLGLMTPSRTTLSLISFCMLLIFSMACLTEDESKNIKHDTDENRDVFVLGDKPDSDCKTDCTDTFSTGSGCK